MYWLNLTTLYRAKDIWKVSTWPIQALLCPKENGRRGRGGRVKVEAGKGEENGDRKILCLG